MVDRAEAPVRMKDAKKFRPHLSVLNFICAFILIHG